MIFVLNENIIKKKFTIHKRGDVWIYSIDNSSLKQLPNRDGNRPYIINFQVSIYLNISNINKEWYKSKFIKTFGNDTIFIWNSWFDAAFTAIRFSWRWKCGGGGNLSYW